MPCIFYQIFSKVLGFKKTSVIIIIYTVIDYMIIGGISLFTPFVLIALIMIPLTLTTVFKKVEEPIYLAFLGILYSFIYSLLYVLATVLINEVNFIAYLASDIIFEVILAASTFISVLWLYTPLKKFLDEKL